jgi:hypothetical protein
LWRWRNYVDIKATDKVRVYVEMIDSSIFNQELPATGIDLNRWNIQNAFVDIKVGERDGQAVIFRAGRQELLYGAQHLISPLDWGNTRRNFEGFKVSSKGDVWDLDAFVTRPVNTATGNGPLSRFDNERDRADASRTFQGVYGVYHGVENQTIDAYWLWLNEQEPIAGRPDGSRHTTGLRWAGTRPISDCCDAPARIWSWDVEGAYQFGHDNGNTVSAAFFSANMAHQWKQAPWQPKLTSLFYWGSDDHDPTDGQDNTFNTLFPLRHAYWGFIDNLTGQNLADYSVQLSVAPTKKLTMLGAWHWFFLDRNTDVLYNVAGAPSARRTPALTWAKSLTW